MNETVIQPTALGTVDFQATQFIEQILSSLATNGMCLLRDTDMTLEKFNTLLRQLCPDITFDPARTESVGQVQKVDAGTSAIGFHIENGNTPNVPELVAFYSHKAARRGSETTVCDGARLWEDMSESEHSVGSQALSTLFQCPLTVERRLQPLHWKRYLLGEVMRQSGHTTVWSIDDMTRELLMVVAEQQPGLDVLVHEDESATCRITFDPVRQSRLGGLAAFANAILGPSFHYEPPVYRFPDGEVLSADVINALTVLAERHTQQVNWQDGDLLLLDNHRVMHGRREILDASHRQIFIGMGNMQ